MPKTSEIRYSFYRHFMQQIGIIWPVISGLLVVIAGMGILAITTKAGACSTASISPSSPDSRSVMATSLPRGRWRA